MILLYILYSFARCDWSTAVLYWLAERSTVLIDSIESYYSSNVMFHPGPQWWQIDALVALPLLSQKVFSRVAKFLTKLLLIFLLKINSELLCPSYVLEFNLRSVHTRELAPETRSRAACWRKKAPSSALTISSEKKCCTTKLLLPSSAPSYQIG